MSYYYEYETSPRKLKPEYDRNAYSNPQMRKKKINNTKTEITQKVTTKNNVQLKFPVKTMIMFFIIFLVTLSLIYMDAKVNEAFSKIQSLKTEMSNIQKENDQLEIGIQNSLNLNNIEQAAKELLGMQKLSNKQIVYINLSKEDYVLPTTETIIIEDESSILDRVVQFIKDVI